MVRTRGDPELFSKSRQREQLYSHSAAAASASLRPALGVAGKRADAASGAARMSKRSRAQVRRPGSFRTDKRNVFSGLCRKTIFERLSRASKSKPSPLQRSFV